MLMSEVFFICNEHLDVMLAEFLVYKAEMQVGGLLVAERCRNGAKFSICCLADLKLVRQEFYCHGFILGNA